jgi:hypothetical protein
MDVKHQGVTAFGCFPLAPAPVWKLGLASLLIVAAGQAATFNIANGDVAGLIAAIQTANTNGGSSNVINLAPKGTYVLTAVADSSPDSGASGAAGLPYVRNTLTINGNGATIARSTASGTPDFVILEVSANLPDGQQECQGDGPGPRCNLSANLTLNGVTLTGGVGGLHMTYAPAFIQNSTITRNTGGGGIGNTCGSLTLLNSTVSYNTSSSLYGGGGVFLWQYLCWTGYPQAHISFSTFYENANSQGPGEALGSGPTAAGNARSFVVKNSILASPSHTLQGVCNGNTALFVSLGHNIAGDASCGLTGPGDMNSTDPLLGPTIDNGGATPTDLPGTSSPAIDGVPLSYCSDVLGNPVATDQRGVARPQGPACDVGSVEVVRYHICLLYDPTKAVQSGATYPIKLQLCDANGSDLSSSTIALHATSVTQVSTSISGEVQGAGNANPDSDFRFDSTLGSTGGYIFNLKTSGLTTGSYDLNFTVAGNPLIYAVPFQVK